MSVSGGTSPYSYSWSNGGTDSSITGLCAGTYTVTVTDNNGCQAVDSVVVGEPPALSVYISSFNEPTCNGSCDGSLSASANGGTLPYTYQWGNGATSQSINNLCAGTYTVTVTDDHSCQDSVSFTLNEPDSIVSTFSILNSSCYGSCDGSIDLTVNGGTSPYSYSWSNGNTTEDINNLCAGWYYVTITDNNGCTKEDSAEVIEPPVLSLVMDSTNASCHGTCDGSASVSVSGGTSPYSYSWSNGATDSSITGLCAGVYTVTVTDNNGCQKIDSIEISEPTALVLNMNSSDATCHGVCDGSASVSVSGGTSPYSYSWSNGATDSSITGLCAGTYTVTVTDNNGCQEQDTVTINEPLDLSAYISAYDYPTCPGDCDGDITVDANGGTLPYSYAWSTGDSSQSIDSLCAGTYYATVIDAHGCQDTVSFTLTEPPAIVSNATPSDALCNNSCDGSINLGVSGGVSPYTYQWSNGATTEDINNLCASWYYVTITDANGCTKLDSAEINEPPALNLTLDINSQPTCNGVCDGSITANVNGGTAPYTYSWNDGETTQTATSLCDGNVSVTITDANGCEIIGDTVLIAPQVLSVSLDTSTNPSCFGLCNGVIDISVSGGTTPYTYSWSNGATSDSIYNLCADTFVVTVTDANGCNIVDTNILVSPLPLSDSIETISPLCYGDCNGSIEVFASGGTAPYNYNWNNGATNDSIGNLCSDTFIVTITDVNGCNFIDTINLDQPDSLYFNFNVTEPLCAGECNGNASVQVFGGTPSYFYNWSTGGNTSYEDSLCAGTYTVTVTDSNGCQFIKDTTIAEPLPLQVQFSDSGEVSCYGMCDGYAVVNVTGGTMPYSYNWSNGDTTTTADSLCAGITYVTVVDANGCSIVDSIEIQQPDSLYITVDTVTEAYCGQCVAYIVVSAHGGSPAYNYLWSTGATNDSIGNLCPDIYSVTVTDTNGCSVSSQVNVVDTSNLNVSLTVNNIPCNGGCNGSIVANVTGGTPPYIYTWSTGSTDTLIDSLCAGTYTLTVVDANNCMRVEQGNVVEAQELIYNTEITNVTCNGLCDGGVVVHPFGGTPPYSITWENGYADTVMTSLCAGVYSFTISDTNGCAKQDSIEIMEPPMLSDTLYQVDSILCFGYNTASVVINVSGGTAPYSYTWSNGASEDTLTNLTGGWYYVTVTDTNGCELIDSIEVVQPDSVVITFTDVSILPCAGICTGHAQVSVSGGTSPYTYNWSNGDTGIVADSLCGGFVYVTIVDNNGCIYSDSVNIIDTSNLSIVVDTMKLPTCYGYCDGYVQVSGLGGFPPYTYQWDSVANYQTGTLADSLCAGEYTVTITDDSGCYRIDTISLSNPQPITVFIDSSASGSLITCYNECSAAVSVGVSGGIPPYVYSWSHDSLLNSNIADSLCGGTYTVIVIDTNGCEGSLNFDIHENGEINIAFDVTNPLCEYGSDDGNIIANVTGGSGSYLYQWSTGATGDSLMNLGGGVYTLTVTDSIGCSKIDSTNLMSQILVVAVADTDTTICPGDTIMIYGYTNGERFEWSPTDFMIDTNSLTPLVHPNDTTIYIFTAYDTICYNWDSVVVNVYPPLNIDAGEDVTIMSGQNVQLEVTSSCSGCTYQWMPSDGLNNDTIVNPVAEPEETTTYYVVVTDVHGCSEIDSVKVTVLPQLIIPTGITPNGDGLNDVWTIDHIDMYPNVEVEIYNRWGERLFYSKGYPPSERWDGTYKGKKLPTGTYYFVIKLNDPTVPEPITGTITIMY